MTGLPQGWARAKIPDVLAELPTGNIIDQGWSPKCENFPSESEDTWGALKTTAIQDGRFEPQHTKQLPEHLEPKPALEVREGDLLMTCAGPRVRCGVICRVERVRPKLFISGKMYRFRPNPEVVEGDYLLGALRSPDLQLAIDQIKTGGSESGLNLTQDRFKSLSLPLPPLTEQRKIVRKLDTLSARSTTALIHLTAIEKLVERMRGAVLSQALSGRLVPSQFDYGEPTELGRFITGIEQGWSPKCDNEPELDPDKWAVLTTTAIQAITFDSTENKRLPENLSPRPHLTVEVGDVLMTRAGPRVRCAVCCYVAETAPHRIFSDKVYRIRLDQSVEPEFFVMVMNAPEMVRALDAIKSGGSESGLNLTQDRLKSLEIKVWDRSTQVEVVSEIKRQFAKIDRLAAEAAKALKLLGHLDQRILAKAFSGELVPQDPNDEPAELLLARIKAERAAEPKAKRGRRKAEA